MMAALIGCLVGYVITLVFRPGLIPPVLRLGSIVEPTTILFLGTDVVYNEGGRKKIGDKDAFTGRSDTIMVARLDPYRNTLGIVQIPRDTQVYINGFGTQKINAANAIGGPNLAVATVSRLLQLPIDHFVILNVHGLVELVDEMGGITLEVPKRMHYMDWTAKLKIDLEPGAHTLTGNQCMGFVRFRHDGLGDIGRVQRQEIFMRAVLDKAMKPESWTHLPKLLEIAKSYLYSDLNLAQIFQMASFVRAVPKSSQFLAMLPGNFSSTGDWLVEPSDVRKMVARVTGSSFVTVSRDHVSLAIINASSSPDLAFKLYRLLANKGYTSVAIKASQSEPLRPIKVSRIVAQRGNPEDAGLVHDDLGRLGEIVNASVGDIQSAVTIFAGDDLAPLFVERPMALRPLRSHHRAPGRS